MISKFVKQNWLTLIIASACLWSGTQAQAQGQRTGGGSTRSTANRSGGYGGGYGGSSSSTRDYNNNTMVGDATISADMETRRLIVVTDEETAANISQVVSNLDRPKPQVLIKVVFLEVTHNNDLDVGVEASYTKNIGGASQGGLPVAVSNVFGLAAQGFSGGNTMPTGAGLYSIAGNDFQATLRAIQAEGKSEVLSRPSVMVRNNQPASITVGEQIPLISNTRFDTVGNQISSYSYLDIGIILQVTPFITADGLVQLIVAPEISDLTDQSISISKDVSIPVISKRAANTVVVTPDRTPVVIGGLMGKNKKTIETKIPLLGDIPGLGYLFKRKQTFATKTELLVFLTPYVVRSPGEVVMANQSETDKVDMLPRSFEQQDLDKFLEGVPMKKPDTKKEKK